jgi:hypothetical protein
MKKIRIPLPCRLAACALTFALGNMYSQAEPKSVVTLCEALAASEKLAGKVFDVRGYYISSREIAGVFPIGCKPTMTIDGIERPAAAAVRIPTSDEIDGFKVDRPSLEKLWDAVGQNRSRAYNPGLKVVLKVRMNLPSEAQSYFVKDGIKRQLGFGHLGVFAFRFDIIAVEKIEDETIPGK